MSRLASRTLKQSLTVAPEYRAGADHARHGGAVDDCPHPIGSCAAGLWVLGFDDAEQIAADCA